MPTGPKRQLGPVESPDAGLPNARTPSLLWCRRPCLGPRFRATAGRRFPFGTNSSPIRRRSGAFPERASFLRASVEAPILDARSDELVLVAVVEDGDVGAVDSEEYGAVETRVGSWAAKIGHARRFVVT